MSGIPMLTPFATPIASTSGTSRPCGPEQRPPGEQAGVRAAARRGVHDRRRTDARRVALVDASRRTPPRSPTAPIGVDPPIGIAYGAAPDAGQLVGERLAGDLEFAPVALLRSGEVQMGAEERRQQLVAGGRLGAIARQHQVDLEPEHRAGGSRHPAVVRLRGTDGDQRARALGHRGAAEELELACLVPAHPEPGEVVALHPEPTNRRAASAHVRAVSAALRAELAEDDRTPSA